METGKFRVRTATLGDVGDLHHLINLSVRGLQQDDYTPEQIQGALGHVLGLDTQLIQDQTYFLASSVDHPETPVACGGWSFRKTLFGSDHGPGRAGDILDPATDPAKIRAIFVHPDWARQGLGSLILGHCEEAAEAAGFHHFEMGSTLTGVPLYTLKGYRAVQDVMVPLPNGEALPIVHMIKGMPDTI
jgi:GNAT superfamily N-acetyltransferase